MSSAEVPPGSSQRWKFLPPIGSAAYYVLLGCVAIFILGPLGGVTAAYMNFSLGFFIGGQVLAGILGSVVTLGYGPEGKHGANYMQTMAASVSSMSAMGVLIQAMVWLGMEQPDTWKLILFFLCIGMFGVGVGMLYTPILVDRLKLTYPSGLAVANILRALTDPEILKKSVSKLVGGIGLGILLSKIVEVVGAFYGWTQQVAEQTKVKLADSYAGSMDLVTAFSAATFGGGMIVGARISASAILVGVIGLLLTPWLRTHGYVDSAGEMHTWLGEHDPFRKIGFIFSLGTILGAAIIDMGLLAVDAVKRIRAVRAEEAAAKPIPGIGGERKTNVKALAVWVLCWGIALTFVANSMLGVPVAWVVFAIAMAFVFQMINGISQGITDQNPISSAFVTTVLIMVGIGLRNPLIGLLAGSILLVSCTVGVDMQQDRSTGWRLGSNRNTQFLYQMLGVTMGAFLAVVMTRVFLESYPILKQNLFEHPELRDTVEGSKWQAAMTFKFVGILELAKDETDVAKAAANAAKASAQVYVMGLGIVLGVVIQTIRKILQKSKRYQAWRVASTPNKVADFTIDALIIASPYASSFGGFVEFTTSLWFGLGGIFASIFSWVEKRKRAAALALAAVASKAAGGSPGEGEEQIEDMSTTSLIGGGLIAGESLFALFLGLAGLIAGGALAKIFGG
jgi:uncharacterized oligopeptide transporter (OPT) family protein